MRIASVIVDVPTRQTNRSFDYLVPSTMEGIVQVGVRVIVPFGNRKVMGFVVGMKQESDFDRLKEIEEVLDLTPVLTTELLKLGKWLAKEMVSFYIQTYQAMLPRVLKASYNKEIVKMSDEPLPDSLEQIFAGRQTIDYDEFVERKASLHALRKQIDEGNVRFNYIVKSKENRKKLLFLQPAKELPFLEEALLDLPKRAKKQREILEYFIHHTDPIEQRTFLQKLKTSSSTLQPLIDRGLIKKVSKEIYRNPYEDSDIKPTEALPLSPQQKNAIEPIWESVENKEHRVFLLHGVTGSGKTEVYLQAIERVLEKGQEAIVLVPEIALTPQMVHRFKGRFGKDVAVLHSGLSQGEKFDEWTKIQRKEVRVAVGARSAIFAPFENLGIIIIDEEHETSYKQDEQPKYHAREVAKFRGEYHQCPVILGSATPLLESYARAKKGVYTLLEMPHRMNKQAMPPVEIIDMRDELHAGNRTMFSRRLMEAIQDKMAKGEQIVLFLNRRGYSTFVMCRECGDTVKCPSCDISLTYHKATNELKCHYCNYRIPMVTECPTCQSQSVRYFGTGTQKVEESLLQLLPDAKIIRMDVDTTRRKGAHERLLRAFSEKKADILLGTQMIAKGLDFENVTLVGVLAIDTMLQLPDFRSSEKTFQLLTQVSGRAGRHHLPGEVIIQTYSPEHYSIELASKYDYDQFFYKEMEMRRQFRYPPYYYLTLLNVSHPNEMKAYEVTKTITQLLRKHLSNQVTILGPTPSPIVRINNRYRYQCMIKYKNEPNQLAVIRKILNYYHDEMIKNDLMIQVDLEPYQLM